MRSWVGPTKVRAALGDLAAAELVVEDAAADPVRAPPARPPSGPCARARARRSARRSRRRRRHVGAAVPAARAWRSRRPLASAGPARRRRRRRRRRPMRPAVTRVLVSIDRARRSPTVVSARVHGSEPGSRLHGVTLRPMLDVQADAESAVAAAAPAARRGGARARARPGNVSARDGDRGRDHPDRRRARRARAPSRSTVVGPRRRASSAATLAPTSELDLHLGVYRRYGAGAVVHTHAPMATALSCVLDELPCVHYQMLAARRHGPGRALRDLRHARARRVGARGARGPHRRADGEPRRDHLRAPTCEAAVELSLLLEWACTVYWRAAAIGTPRVARRAEQQDAVIAAAVERGYGADAGRRARRRDERAR